MKPWSAQQTAKSIKGNKYFFSLGNIDRNIKLHLENLDQHCPC